MKRFVLSIVCLLSLMLVLSSCGGMGRKSYDITFNTNGGSAVETQVIEHDKKVTRPENPTKEGYTFIDWYSDETLVSVYDFNARVRKPFTIYAGWKINEYTLSYVTNVDAYEIKSVTLDYNTKIDVPEVDEELFKIEGSHFVGWYTDEAFTKAFEKTTMPANNLTLYAKWEKNDHKLTFINDDLTYKTFDVKYGDAIPTVDAPTKLGHTFAGWALSETATELVPQDYKIVKDVTLYAKWTKNKYVITFDSNGGSNVEGVEYNYYDELSAPTAPTKEGHTFAGWYLGDKYFDFNDERMPAEDITLVAKWTVNEYVVKFNSNGGSAIANANVVYGTKVTAPIAPTRTGYTFAGWYIDKVEYDFETLMPANNIELVAEWVANDITIKFNLNGADGQIADINTKYNETVKAPQCTIERTGWTFVKWNTNADGTGTNYLQAADIKNIVAGGEVTLYAIWTQNVYTLTITTATVNTYEFHYGDSIVETINNINTDKEDAEFDGWEAYINNAWVSFDPANATMPNGDFAIRAKYLGEVTITFVSNGKLFTSFTGFQSEEITQNVTNPVLEGYTFGGWYLDEAYENPYNLTHYPNEENTNVYAKWTANTIIVVFNSNGASEGSMENQSIVYGSQTPLTKNVFKKEGHEFKGWAITEDATEIEFIDEFNGNVGTEGTITLYAVWETLSYTISFDSGIEPISGLYGAQIELPIPSDKNGYTFGGWLLNGEEYTISTIPAQNITLEAKWNAIKYTLTINATKDGIQQPVKTFDIYFDQFVSSYDEITKHALEGYTFAGWYTNAELTNKFEYNEATKVTGDITLYATYTIVVYKVQFISNGNVLYETSKTYKEGVSFNEYVDTTKLYAKAYGELATAIAAVVGGLDNGTGLMGCLQANISYYSAQQGLMDYIGVLYSGGSLSDGQWQQFYGVAKGLADGSLSIVNAYEANKVGDNYVPNHQGHFFGGWYLGADTILDGKTGVEFTNITPASTIGSDIVKIVANWKKLNPVKELSKVENTDNVITWTQIDADQLKPTADETLDIEYLIYNVNSDNTLTKLDTVKHDSTKETLEYVFMTKDTFSAPGTYNLVIIVKAQILNSKNEVVRVYESDVKESFVLENFNVVLDPGNVNITSSGDFYSFDSNTNTFYLFTNMEYKFNAAGTFEFVDPQDSNVVTLDGNKITTKNKTARFQFTNSDNNITYTAYILPYVSQFTLGKGLQNFVDSTSNSTAFYSKNATYTIGRYFEDETLTDLYNKGIFQYEDNGYKFDLNVLTTGGITIDTVNPLFGNYLKYEFYDLDNNPVEIGDYNSTTGAWVFTAPNGNYKVKISINPLYVAPKQIADKIINPVTFNFSIDNSVNVYNHEQFKAVYGNLSIGENLYSDGKVVRGISIHSNIETELEANQYYDYWKNNPINPAVQEGVDENYNQAEALKTHTPINIDNSVVWELYNKPNYANGNVYERVSNKELYETYNINGNCYTIDGTNLPFVNIYSRGNQSAVTGYYIPSNATAIIKYVVSENKDTSQSKLVLRDLHIVGNSTKPVLDESSENFQTSIQLMNKNAGGYMAVNLGYGATLDSYNTFITKVGIAINVNRSCSLNLVDSKLVDCWFNGVYGYANSNVTITNSYLKDFGGAIIHLEDTDSAVKVDAAGNVLQELPKPANVTVDTNSVLENYVSGDEGFFKAYSLEVLIMQLKVGFESNVNKKNWTMIKKVKDPVTGLDYEKVNLMMLLVARGDNALEEDIDKANGIKGAGRNMMNIGFANATTEGLKGVNAAMGTNYTHLNSSMLINYLNGTDLLVQKTNPAYEQAGYLEEGILLTYQPNLPGFGGSIIVTGVNGMPNK